MDTRGKSYAEFRNDVNETLARHKSNFDQIHTTLQGVLTELQSLHNSNKNRPFSQENLQLCLEHSMPDVLPPFESLDVVRNPSRKKCVDVKLTALSDKIISSGFREEKGFESTTCPSYSKINSCQHIKAPCSKPKAARSTMGKPESSAPASRKVEKSTQNFAKNSKLIVKLAKISEPLSIEHSEIMTSVVSPVCKTFSSSSNTTLNAHIEQLSQEINVDDGQLPEKMNNPYLLNKDVAMDLRPSLNVSPVKLGMEDHISHSSSHFKSHGTVDDFGIVKLEAKLSEDTISKSNQNNSTSALEWEPRGSFYQPSIAISTRSGSGTGQNRAPIPSRVILGTVCEELPTDAILLVYLSTSDHSGLGAGCLHIGSRGHGGMNRIYPSDILPFTRRPLFLVIDSENSKAFKAMSGSEKGEPIAMLLSPAIWLPLPAVESNHQHSGCLFTSFLTAPLQSLVLLLGLNGSDIEKDVYSKAEKLIQSSSNEWGSLLAASDNLDPVWSPILSDPFLRRILLRFIFCRAVLSLYCQSSNKIELVAECMPRLPEVVSPMKELQSVEAPVSVHRGSIGSGQVDNPDHLRLPSSVLDNGLTSSGRNVIGFQRPSRDYGISASNNQLTKLSKSKNRNGFDGSLTDITSSKHRTEATPMHIRFHEGTEIHNEFHDSSLRKYMGPRVPVTAQLPSVSTKSTILPQPEAVLGHRATQKGKYQQRSEILIKWKRTQVEDARWENKCRLVRHILISSLRTRIL